MIHLLQREGLYFDFLDRLAEHVVSCTHRLRRLAVEFPDGRAEIGHIHDEEHEADALAHDVLARLERGAIAPIDPDDIHTLVGELDDVVDTINDVAQRFDLYHVERVQPAFVKQVDVLARAAEHIRHAVHALRRTRQLSELQPTLVEVRRLERAGDEVHESALFELFEGRPDPLFALKWKELYGLAEHAIDLCEDVAITLERVALKNA